MPRPKVTVYVRKGDKEGERTVSFHPPPIIPQRQWLSQGFAYDGNSIIASVSTNVLLQVERGLVKQLDDVGYDVEFA